jgi:hypothetical protein
VTGAERQQQREPPQEQHDTRSMPRALKEHARELRSLVVEAMYGSCHQHLRHFEYAGCNGRWANFTGPIIKVEKMVDVRAQQPTAEAVYRKFCDLINQFPGELAIESRINGILSRNAA